MSGYSIFERYIGKARGFVEHKRKTTNSILIEQIKVNTQVHRSCVAGLVDKDMETVEVKVDSEELEGITLKTNTRL